MEQLESAGNAQAPNGVHWYTDCSRVRVGSWTALLTASALLLGAGSAWGAEASGEAPSAGATPRERTVPAWNLRFGIGFGSRVVSDQEELVQAEGYHGPRFHVTAEITKTFGEHFGLGLFALYGWRSAKSSASTDPVSPDPPPYSEHLGIVAGTVPLSLCMCKHAVATVRLAPILGVGFGSADLYGEGSSLVGPAFGGSLELFVPVAHVGAAIGAYFVPVPAPGEAGAHDDLGAYFLSLIVGGDVG
jgi:hypothetical protein